MPVHILLSQRSDTHISQIRYITASLAHCKIKGRILGRSIYCDIIGRIFLDIDYRLVLIREYVHLIFRTGQQ